MDRSLAIGGVLYEIISPSVRNVSLAQEYLKELPEECQGSGKGKTTLRLP